MAMRLSLLISAVDRLSRPVRGMSTAIDRMAERGGRAATRLSGKFDRLARGPRMLGTAAALAANGLVSLDRRGSAALGRLNQRYDLLNRGAYKFGHLVGSTIRNVALGGVAIAGAAASTGIWAVLRAGVAWEQFQIQMTGAMGSARAGESAMKWVERFAKATPYELDDVMGAFIKAKNYGIDPMNGSLLVLGDTASALGKQLGDAIDMLADAQMGEFERTKEFGIKASVKGKDITFSYIDKSMRAATKKAIVGDALSIQRTLLDIFGSKFSGGMDRMSRSVAGKWANLMDFLGSAARKVWNSGVGTLVDKQLARLLAFTDRIQQDGSLDRWAKKTGEWVERMAAKIEDLATNIDWTKLAGDVGMIAGAIRDVTGAIGDMLAFGDRVQSFFAKLQNFGDRWGAMGLMRRGGEAIQARASALTAGGTAPRRDGWRFGAPRDAGRLGPARSAIPARGAATKQQIGGKLSIELTGPGAAQAKVTKLSSANGNVPIEVNRGPVRKAG